MFLGGIQRVRDTGFMVVPRGRKRFLSIRWCHRDLLQLTQHFVCVTYRYIITKSRWMPTRLRFALCSLFLLLVDAFGTGAASRGNYDPPLHSLTALVMEGPAIRSFA